MRTLPVIVELVNGLQTTVAVYHSDDHFLFEGEVMSVSAIMDRLHLRGGMCFLKFPNQEREEDDTNKQTAQQLRAVRHRE